MKADLKSSFARTSLGWILAMVLVSAGSGCSSAEKYDRKIRTWEGKDANVLLKSWGKPDATESQSNGNRIYLYSRLKHEPYVFGDARRTIASQDSSQPVYIRCATYFEVTPQNKIVSTLSRGEECTSRD